MRRMAWNALRSWLGRLGGDVRRFRGELRAQRVDPLAARLEDVRDRALGEPVDLEVRMELPKLGGDRDVALGVPETDGRRDVQRATPASQGSGSRWSSSMAQSRTASVSRDRTKSRISRLARTGWRPGIMWSAPSTTTSGAPVISARRSRAGDRLAVSSRAVDDEHRAGDRAADRLDRLEVQR